MQSAVLDPQSECDLIERAKVDREAFAILYDLHVRRVYSYTYHCTGSRHEAEDATSETFVRALEHIGRYQQRDVAFHCWLYRIASNVVADCRRRRRIPQVDIDEAADVRSEEPLPEEAALRREQARGLREAVATLPESQQQAVVLKFFHGLRNREVGEVMGCSESAVKQLVHRAVRSLRRIERVPPVQTVPEAQQPGGLDAGKLKDGVS